LLVLGLIAKDEIKKGTKTGASLVVLQEKRLIKTKIVNGEEIKGFWSKPGFYKWLTFFQQSFIFCKVVFWFT
jgi:hypothetical protein